MSHTQDDGRGAHTPEDGVLVLTKDELDAMIEYQARTRLGMSGDEFRRRNQCGELPHDNVAVGDIRMLLAIE